MSIVIDAQQVSKRFYLRHNRSSDLKVRFLAVFDKKKREAIEEFWALQNVSLTIRHGEAVALVGRNGSGKSTLLKIVAGLHLPTTGRLLVMANARIGTMIELGVGFNPELSGRENVFLNASVYGMSRRQIETLYPQVVEFSGLAHFMDAPLKNYSSGMHARLGFAILANLDPDIMLIDEVFSVGDAEFQQQCEVTLRQLRERGKTLLFVSHSPDAVRAMCDRVCVLDQGGLIFDGPTEEGLAAYDRLTAIPVRVVREPNLELAAIH